MKKIAKFKIKFVSLVFKYQYLKTIYYYDTLYIAGTHPVVSE
jgi:hypothetical protein